MKVTPPNPLPGRFLLLAFDRESGDYRLFVDDEARSSYNLGADVQAVMWFFFTVDKKLLGDRVIDLATEFGLAQGVFKDDRAFPIHGDPQRGNQRDPFQEKTGLVQLPV